MADTKRIMIRSLLRKNEVGVVLPLLFLYVVVFIINSSFFNITNILDILRTASFSFLVAIPTTFLMSCGGMDLSIGAATSFGGVLCAFCLKAGFPLPVSILIALMGGFTIGLFNGIIIVHFELPAFIATLGTQYVVNGIIQVSTKALAISGFSDSFKFIGQARVSGIPFPVIYAIVLGGIAHILLIYTKYGRSILAIGGNRETAYLSGINVKLLQISAYIASTTFAALSGILIASRFATAQPASGTGTELTIIASVIIGGTSMFGGSGTVIGSALGCILLATIINALIVMGVSSFWQNLIFGIILLISLFIDKYRRKASSGE
ncbi:MAG: ABC transporter permease [Treponema sp.]|nr:ABC transporter permease [Treponema sp.]